MNASDENRLNTLVSLYSTERSDLASIGNQNIAIVGLALTYIVAVVFGLAQSVDKQGVSIFWLAAPIPLLVFLAFYTLFVSLAHARTNACRVLENRILDKIPGVAQDTIGVTVSDKIMDPGFASMRQKWLIVAAYGPVILAIPTLTVYILIRAFRHHTNQVAVGIAIAFYVLLVLPSIWVWAKDFIMIVSRKPSS